MSSADLEMGEDEENDFPWSVGLFDAHCHPTDTMSMTESIPTMNTRALTIMATRAQDQSLVAEVARKHPKPSSDAQWRGIVPSYGWHPWFSHQIHDESSDADFLQDEAKAQHYKSVLSPIPESMDFLNKLPRPRSLKYFIQETRERLVEFPHALVGEVGLDRGFRIPESWLPVEHEIRDETLTPGGREGRKLSPYKVQMTHQRKVLTAQLRLAGELQRAASVHGVQAHGVLYETIECLWKGHEKQVLSKSQLKRRRSVADAHATDKSTAETRLTPQSKPFPPRLCLHSYSGPPENLELYFRPHVPVEVYASFSIAINFSSNAATKAEQAIKVVPDDRILVESDMHIAGDDMDNKLKLIARKVCELKSWPLEAGLQQLRRNWTAFIFGHSQGDADG